MNCLCSFVKGNLTLFVLFSFLALYSVPLIYFSILWPVAYCLCCCIFIINLEAGEYPSLDSVLQNCFDYSESFVFPHILWNQSVIINKITFWDFFNWNYIESKINLKETVILTYWLSWSLNTDLLSIYWIILFFSSEYYSFLILILYIFCGCLSIFCVC